MSKVNTKCKPLDTLLAPEKQYHFHRVLTTCSFFTGINPKDPYLQTQGFRLYRAWVIFFLFSVCLRTVVECFVSQPSPFFLYIGDFKIWWGHPYIANQVVFIAAVFIVPFYQWINLATLCSKDHQWAVPFHFIEGFKTAREIHLEEEQQMESLYFKMKINYYRSYIMMYSVIISYVICVFASYYIFYQTNLQVFTLGVFWTLYEYYWTTFITQNMGIYPACLEVLIHYLILRYNSIEQKLQLAHERMRMNRVVWEQHRVQQLLAELNSTHTSLYHYNHYWRKYMMAVFASYVPQILFELYVCLFFDMGTNIFVFSVTLMINMFSLISQLCIFSASIYCKAYSMRKILTGIYNGLQKRRNAKSTHVIRSMLKLSCALEQYDGHGKQLGIYLLDFYIIDWSFYFRVIVNCVLYFLLIADMLQARI